jgi:sugar phosphate isomerase/epimerase
MATHPTRRRFLQAGAAAAAGLAALPARPAAAKEPERRDDGFGGLTVGIQSYTFRNFPLEQCLRRTRDLGLHHIELNRGHVPLTSTPRQIRAVRELCRQYHITPVAFGVEGFTSDHDANRRVFEFARRLGVRYLSADPSPDSFDSLDRLVREFDIRIAIHPHGPQGPRLHRWYSAEVILRAVRDHDRRIGTCLDTGHLIRCAQPPFDRHLDPPAEVRVMGARNFGLHLKDHDNQTRRDVVFGLGALNVLAVLRALRAVHFGGYVSIEYEANPDDPSPDVRVCLDVLRSAVGVLGPARARRERTRPG